MPTHVTYLFDPLCGWCYGASPAIAQLAQHDSMQLALLPTGLFAGGGRTMDAAFADYAWANDQRIAQLTGQRFTEAYRQQVLGKVGSPFDSAAATMALTAVSLTAPQQELAVLRLLQEARYVQGLDICNGEVVEQLLRAQGLAAVADQLRSGDASVSAASAARTQQAQRLMHAMGAQGVPALVVHGAQGNRLLGSHLLYGDFARLLHEISAMA